jgi:hypothetical protein
MVVFATTCKGRTQHLARTLPQNIADNPGAKFVVVNYNDQDHLMPYLRANHIADVEHGRLTVYHYREPVAFRMAHAKNMAHRCAAFEGADILVNLDADNFTGPGFAEYVDQQFEDGGEVFLWSRMVKSGDGRLPRGISGRIACTREAFFLAGGYDEKYETHSPDDKDFHARLHRLRFDAVEIDPVYLRAIPHNDKMRFRDYPQAAGNVSEDFAVHPESSVANRGSIGCGTVYRNFTEEAFEIKRVPTRIFGIGMHKTATTSLHTALQILGFKSGHWQNAHWAKAIWREMNQSGKSPTLERFYALSDLPIPMMFKKLDAAYPGSKFILTTRDEWSWLTSVRKHWNPNINQHRAAWDTDPFSHRVHAMLYGRRDFDPTTFLERYRRHNAEVLEHFKDRPGDLLVMPMDNGGSWPALCGFLGVPVPETPYPVVGAARA